MPRKATPANFSTGSATRATTAISTASARSALLLAAGNLSKSKDFTIQRTYYEQWFTQQDASAVTFSSGRVLG